MNLKEAFRYQRFLDTMLNMASAQLVKRENCLHTTEHHLLSKFGAGEEDKVIEPKETDYIGNDSMLMFALALVQERGLLSNAIDKAKAALDIDLDAAVEINKFRQRLASSIAQVLSCKSGTTTGPMIGYRLNAISGSQERYQYEVEYSAAEAFDRAAFATARRELLKDAEETSAAIDLAILTGVVEYEPPFDVTSSFDEVIAAWGAAPETEESAE